MFQLWWVIGAVIEALQQHGLESGQSVKRLLGLGDREIRRLYEQGEARYAQSPAVELLNNLLYYVGRAESSGPRVNAVRASFRLAELLPVDESIEQERENLSAPSVKLMQTVAAAIREDLAKVKDVLDIFVRRGAGPAAGARTRRSSCCARSATRSACSASASCAPRCRSRPSASARSSTARSRPTRRRWWRSPRP